MAASFDASVLSDIGGYGPNPVKAQEDAYTLANAAQGYQSNALDLQARKRQASDEAAAREALKGQDLSTFEGQTKAAQALTKINPKMGMDFMGKVQQNQAAQGEMTLQRLQIADAQQDAIVGAIDPIVAQLEQERQSGREPALLDARAKQLAIPALLQLRQNRPDLAPMIDRFQQDPNALTLNGLKSAEAQSKRGSQAIKDRIAQMRADEAARENKSRDEREDRKTSLAEQKEADKQKEAEEGVITDDSAQLAVDRMLNGEQARDVLANFGRGKQGPANIAKVQNLLAKTAKDRGISSQEISARMVEMKGLAKEQQTEASIAGKISYAEKEIQQIGPKVLEASEKVPRGTFVPWNKLRNMTSQQLSDPNLKQLKAYLTTLTNSYDVLGGRGGTDVEKRAHNRELLDAADSPEALKAAVDAITQEAALSHEAARESMTVDRSRLGGSPSTPAGAGGAGGTPPPAGAASPAGGQGGWGKASVVGGT